MTEQLRSHDQVAIKGDIVKEDLDQIELNLSEFSPKIKDKTFVVSGGAGFLGSWFSDAAIRMGGRVVCVDNLIAGSQKSILHLKDHQTLLVFGDLLLRKNECLQ